MKIGEVAKDTKQYPEILEKLITQVFVIITKPLPFVIITGSLSTVGKAGSHTM